MNIVVLDGYTTNPGDLSWSVLEKFGTVTVYDRSKPDEVIERAKDAEILILNKVVLTGEILHKLPNLKFVSLLSTGTNSVDLKCAEELGIHVSNAPGYSTDSVAQMTFSLILELVMSVGGHSDDVRNARWVHSKDFCFWSRPLVELSGKTLGIIGYGAIGHAVEKIAKAFFMNVKIYSRSYQDCTIDELLHESDIVTLHCPLTEANSEMVNEEFIAKMKDGAYLINTARGGLINETALANALNSGKLSGAGLDVLSSEPPEENNPLLKAKNTIITPHIAWATYEARSRLMKIEEANIEGYIKGKIINEVTK